MSEEPTIRLVRAAERVDRLAFDSVVEYRDHVVELAAYLCPHCATGVEFTARHLLDGIYRSAPSLKPEWRARFDAELPPRARYYEAALEFHCPGCSAPVRILYLCTDDYKSFKFKIQKVQEVCPWPEQDRRPGADQKD